jgi:hypothetical protein
VDWIDLAQIGISGGLLWTRYWTFGFHKLLGSSSSCTIGVFSRRVQLHQVSYLMRIAMQCNITLFENWYVVLTYQTHSPGFCSLERMLSSPLLTGVMTPWYDFPFLYSFWQWYVSSQLLGKGTHYIKTVNMQKQNGAEFSISWQEMAKEIT